MPAIVRRTASWLPLAVLAAVVALLVGHPVGPAAAHTDFESSVPADGAEVAEPVDVVVITFSGAVVPVGDGFVALDSAGAVQQPVDVQTVDDRVFTLRFDPPLADGSVGVRWAVQSEDSHVIEGAFSFTVDAAPTETTVASTPPTTGDPADAAGGAVGTSGALAESNDEDDADLLVAADGPIAADDSSATGSTSASDETATSGEATSVDGASGEEASAAAPIALDEFLSVDDERPGEATARIGRLIGYAGVVVGLGALAFAANTLRGPRREIAGVLLGVRVLGGVVALGAVIEYVGLGRLGAQPVGEVWSTSAGFATVLRVVGGIAIAAGIAATVVRARPGSAPGGAPRPLSATVLDEPDARVRPGDAHAEPVMRWRPTVRSLPALVGAGLIVASFWFDGHTASTGVRPLHAAVNSVHVIAGSIWAGGVVTMAVVLWHRHRTAAPLGGADMAVRFSSIATVALVAVLAAGAVMAIVVLDSPADLTGTEWGRVLLLKSGAVAVAALAGAYNHFRLLPVLDTGPASSAWHVRLRAVLTAEAIVLVFVVVVTASLVAAAT